MRCLQSALVTLLLVSLPAFSALPAAVDGQALPSLAPMLERTTPAVVNIATRGKARSRIELPIPNDPFFRRFFDLPELERERETSSLGSGVIIDAERGLILTNDHVIKDAFEITVTLTDGRVLQADILGRDSETDVAVIQVPAGDLVDIPLADSSALRVGDFVVAVGNPFGLGQTVTSGIVSALGRSGLGIETIEDFIQTDASINPGNSGGALLNLRGELVGINTAIYGAGGKGNIGIGFAIPVNLASDIMLQLLEHGEVKRGRLGARGQDLTPQLAQAFGVDGDSGLIITQIEAGSPAEKSGLRVGDVVVMANEKPIRSARDMHNLVGMHRLGQEIEITVFRKGLKNIVPVTIQPIEVPELSGGRLHEKLEGAVLGEFRELRLQRDTLEYLKIVDIVEESNAAVAGFEVGDVIYSINKQKTDTFEAALAAVGERDGNILVNIQRGQRELYLLVK